MKSEDRRTKSTEIPNFTAEYKWKVGDRVVFLVGTTSKKKIELGRFIDNKDMLSFSTGENFAVDESPYIYFCEVQKVSPECKITFVRLVRVVQQFRDGGIGILDYGNEVFDLYAPNIFRWFNGNCYETYVIRAYTDEVTPLMGAACKWNWAEDYGSVIEYSEEKTIPETLQ